MVRVPEAAAPVLDVGLSWLPVLCYENNALSWAWYILIVRAPGTAAPVTALLLLSTNDRSIILSMMSINSESPSSIWLERPASSWWAYSCMWCWTAVWILSFNPEGIRENRHRAPTAVEPEGWTRPAEIDRFFSVATDYLSRSPKQTSTPPT